MAIVNRRSVTSSSLEQIADYREAVRQIQDLSDNRGYNYLAGLHGAPGGYCWHHQRRAGLHEGVRLFLPWHRAYLYRYEQALQDRVEGVSVPWWDWRSERSRSDGVPVAFSQAEVNGEHNSLFDAHVLVPSANLDHRTRRFPSLPSELPPADTVTRLLESFSQWADFNDELEEIHDNIHGWVGGYSHDDQGWPLDADGKRIPGPDPRNSREQWVWGDMGRVATAAFDPVFWSHHCMIDRIWALWQQAHGNSGIPPSVLDLVLEPFNLQVRDVLDIHELGYEYVGAEFDAPGAS